MTRWEYIRKLGQSLGLAIVIFSGHPEGSDLVGCYATYSYIESVAPGEGNIDGDPNYPPFVNGADDDYHLEPNSPCIDIGDPDGDYSGERDIDKQFRLLDGNGNGEVRVDMGADEYCDPNEANPADFNEDGIVDTADLVEMAAAWLIDDSDPCWAANYDKYDLNADDVIHYGDFAYFAQEWLWFACWKTPDLPIEMMMGGGMDKMGGGESMLMAEQQAESQQSYSEPTIEEQIAQIKRLLKF